MNKIGYIGYFIVALFAIYFSYTFVYAPSSFNVGDGSESYSFVSGVIEDIHTNSLTVNIDNKIYDVKIDMGYFDNEFIPGQKISLVEHMSEQGEMEYGFVSYYFLDGLIIIIAIFCLLVVAFARYKGLFSLFSVFVSLILFYTIFISMVRIGYDPMFSAMIYIFFLTVLTVPLIHGFNLKSLSALIAIFIGYLIGYLMTIFFLRISMVQYIPHEEFRNLGVQFGGLDVYSTMLAVVFIGIVGALIDTVISIVSAVYESMKESTIVTFRKAYKIGIEVGHDVLGSMTNTLLLAFLASSIPFMITMSIFKGDGGISEMMNYDVIAFEIVRIFVSGSVLALVIPLAAVVVAYFVGGSKRFG